jgi:hypothetical protein
MNPDPGNHARYDNPAGYPGTQQKKTNRWLVALIVVTVGIVMCCLGTALANAISHKPATPTPAGTALGGQRSPVASAVSGIVGKVAPASHAPAGPATTFGDGVHVVGTDIRPGTYHTTVKVEQAGFPFPCYWERESALDGELSSVIANDDVAPGPLTVTVKSTDRGFKSQGCGTWTLTP